MPDPTPGGKPELTTEAALDQLLGRYRSNASQLSAFDPQQPLTKQVPDDTGKLTTVVTDAGRQYTDLVAQQKALEGSMQALGYDPKTLGGSRQTADSSAATGLGYARIAADQSLAALTDARERELNANNNQTTRDVNAANNQTTRDVSAANNQTTRDVSAANNATSERNTDVNAGVSERGQNIESVLKILDGEIARGTLSVQQASAKLKGVTDAANLQRDVLHDYAPYALDPGATSFPGFGPGGAITQLAAALGAPNINIATGGMRTIIPSAMAQPIVNATNAIPDAAAGVGTGIQQALGLLGKLGVPADTRTGMPPGPSTLQTALSGAR